MIEQVSRFYLVLELPQLVASNHMEPIRLLMQQSLHLLFNLIK